MDPKTRTALADLIDAHSLEIKRGKYDPRPIAEARTILLSVAGALNTLESMATIYGQPCPPAWGKAQANTMQAINDIADRIRDPQGASRITRARSILIQDKRTYPLAWKDVPEPEPDNVDRYLLLSHVPRGLPPGVAWCHWDTTAKAGHFMTARVRGGHINVRVYDLDRDDWGTPLDWTVSIRTPTPEHEAG